MWLRYSGDSGDLVFEAIPLGALWIEKGCLNNQTLATKTRMLKQ